MCASAEGHTSTVQVLLEEGADWSVLSKVPSVQFVVLQFILEIIN